MWEINFHICSPQKRGILNSQSQFLDALAKLWNATITFIMSVRPFSRMEQLCSHERDFHEIWYLIIFRQSFEKIQVSLKYDKKNGHFTWRSIYIFDQISLSSSYNEKNFRHSCTEYQNTHFMFSNFLFRKSCPVWDFMEEYFTVWQATEDNMAHCKLST